MTTDLDAINLRVMRAEEFEAVRALSIEAFVGAPRIGPLLDQLRASWAWDDGLSFVAEADGDLVGHALYTHATLDAPTRLQDVLVLSPIGVRPDRQLQGIGRRLIEHSMDVIAATAAPLVFLEGDPAYYRRFGFVRADELGFTSPSVRIPPPAFQVRPLSRHEPWMTGALVYPDPFWRADCVGLRDESP